MKVAGGVGIAGDNPTTSAVTHFSHMLWRRYQHLLDKSTPLVLYRWIFLSAIALMYALRIYGLQGFYITTYGLGIYILQLLIAFLSPQVDPEIHELTDGPALPTRGSDEFRPFVRRLPEFKFWYSLTKAFCFVFVLTFFSAFDVPVFWPILLFYWLVLFISTMKRQILHMIKYKYVPFTFGKQHTLRSLCTSSDSSNSSKWVYAVFWRILPRNYPPPKWDNGLLDRAKGNKRNWILVWEDGFCDFCECETAGSGYVKGRFGADIFFKMSHEVYNFGEGLVGKIAADNSHKWVFRDTPTESDPTFMSSWNVSIDPQQPRAWEAQFNSGIETIAIISVREGAIQLGSFDKVVEDLNLVLSIQRKFSYLQSILGMYPMQRPYLSSIQNPNNFDCSNSLVPMAANGILCGIEGNHRKIIGLKRQNYGSTTDDSPTSKSIFLGYNSPHNCINGSLPVWSVPPLLPSTPSNLGAFLSKIPTVPQSYYAHTESIHDHESTFLDNNLKSGRIQDLKVDECGGVPLDEIPITNIKVEDASCAREATQEEKPRSPSRFESHRGTCLRVTKNLN